MAVNSERLIDFPVKTTPTGSDILYVGDLSDAGNEVKSTVDQVVSGSTIPLKVANNLSDVASAPTARSNLGLGTAATQNTGTFLQTANNLSDVPAPTTARSNLGLGSAATQNTSAFLQPANNLSDVANAATARTNLGLGTAATQATGTFAQVANNLSDLINAATARANLGITGSPGKLPLTVNSNASVTIVVNNAYLSAGSGGSTYTLPATSTVGDLFAIGVTTPDVNAGAFATIIRNNVSQKMYVSEQYVTEDSTDLGDTISVDQSGWLVFQCTKNDLSWQLIDGNFSTISVEYGNGTSDVAYVNLTNNLIPPKNILPINVGGSIGSVMIPGQTVVFGGSSAISVPLPSPAVCLNRVLGFQNNTTSNAIVTISDSLGGTISGQSSIALGSGDSGQLFCPATGGSFVLNNVTLQPGNFRAYRSTSATLPATGSSLTVLLDTEVRDIGGFYATGTGIWTSLLPGVGLCGGQVMVDFDGTEDTVITLQLQKNGSAIVTDIQQGYNTVARKIRLAVFDGDINFNGSTDNYKLVISQTGANTQTILGTIDQTFFYGARRGSF